MVEKVARAICRSMLQDPDIDYEVHHQDGLVKGWKMYESEAMAAIEAMQVMWQPIETAPKDGTCILLYADITHLKRGEMGMDVGFYVTHRSDDFWAWSYIARPTHWMPLPLKPEAE